MPLLDMLNHIVLFASAVMALIGGTMFPSAWLPAKDMINVLIAIGAVQLALVVVSVYSGKYRRLRILVNTILLIVGAVYASRVPLPGGILPNDGETGTLYSLGIGSLSLTGLSLAIDSRHFVGAFLT